MVDVSSDVLITRADQWRPFTAALETLRAAIAAKRETRRVYQRTLRELQAYSRTDLLDMGIDPDGIHALARKAARSPNGNGATV